VRAACSGSKVAIQWLHVLGGIFWFGSTLLCLSYQLIRFIADLVLVRTRSDAQPRAQVLASGISSACSSAESASPPGSLVTASCSRPAAGCCH